MQTETRKIYTLSALGQALEKHFLDQFASKTFWVIAEIVKVSSKSGHLYLELADTKENLTTAQFSAYIWNRNLLEIKSQIGEETNQIIQPGNKALFLIQIEFHKVYGLKLNIKTVDPNYSYGEIEKRKKETITKLKEEGLFDLQKELYFPTLTKRIALIGSPNTSGFRDFKEVLFNNAVFRKFKLKQFSTSVQGDKAKDELIAALKKARTYDVEVIVIIRGGGSKMDLDVFNNIDLCREICLTKIPVLTGIGHETDRVVADMVAHQYFITPTAVAKHLYVQIGNFNYFLNKYFDQVKTKSIEQLSSAKDEFHYQNKYFVHFSQQFIKTWRDLFNEKAHELGKYSQRILHKEREHLSQQRFQAHRSMQNQLHQSLSVLDKIKNELRFYSQGKIDMERLQKLNNQLQQLKVMTSNSLYQEQIKITNLAQLVEMLNPTSRLKSGYTISTVAGKDVFLFESELEGKEMKTLSANQLITSKITAVEKIKTHE